MKSKIRHDWSYKEVEVIFSQPFNDLLFQSQEIHRQNFNPNEIQVSTLLSIKTGACPEDCKYCSQSAHYKTEIEKEKLLEVNHVLEAAKKAKETGATRFCMGAAWRNPPSRDMPYIIEMVKGVKNLGLETCMTLGKLNKEQAEELAMAGLDYYNHNLDTSAGFYEQIVTTRTYEDRLQTLSKIREAGIKVCSGGILGLGETRKDRINLLIQLANLSQHPESVPINRLVKIKGTPLEKVEDLDYFELIRTIAVTRILMPESYVRLSAGREQMSDEVQALAFFAGANSIFYGDRLLTTSNPQYEKDLLLIEKLGIQPEGKKEG